MAHIVWFRQDLRLQDNPALYHACKMGDILPIYIHDTYNPNDTESMGVQVRFGYTMPYKH